MRMRKRVAILLVFVLLLSMLTACGDAESGGAKKGKTREAKAGTASSTPTPVITPTDGPEPTGEPIPTPIPVEDTPTPTDRPATGRATPSPKPTPGPGGIIPAVSEFEFDRPNEALLAFADYLDAKILFLPEDEQEKYHFGVIYLNGDKTPELWWADGDSHVSGVHICMYDGKGVIEVGEFGSYGECDYLEGGNMITSGFMNMGEEHLDIFILDEFSFIPVVRFTAIESADGETIRYFIDDTEVSEEEILVMFADLGDDDFDYIWYDDGNYIDAEDPDEYYPSTYYFLYDEYVNWLEDDPFEYSVPDDVREKIVGTWELTGGETEGDQWSAKQQGVSGCIVINEDMTATFVQETPDAYKFSEELEFTPWQGYFQDSEKWTVGYEGLSTSEAANPRCDLILKKDGTLIRYDRDYENSQVAVLYYKKTE